MRQVLAIAAREFRLLIRSKGQLVVMFLLPLFFAFIFGLLNSGAGGDGVQVVPLAIVNADTGVAGRSLVQVLEQESNLRVRAAQPGEIKQLLADRTVSATLTIPAGFSQALAEGKAPDLALQALAGSNMALVVNPAIQRASARVAGDYQLARRMAGGLDSAQLASAMAQLATERRTDGVSVQQELVRKANSEKPTGLPQSEITLGFIVMFVMMNLFGMGGIILEERDQQTWGRLLTTPVSKVSLLSGYLLSFAAVGLCQFGVLTLASTLLFHVTWGPLLPLFTVALAFILCSAGLGLFVAGLVRTADQQRVVGNILVVATSMMGGVFWPVEYSGKLMQRIAYLTPQAWAIRGFREVILRDGSFQALLWPLAVLIALTLLFMGAGLFRVKYE